MATDTQNVPAEYLQQDGKKFQIGMDARFRGDLIRSVTGDTNDEMFVVFDRKEAIEILKERGWLKFLPSDVYQEVTKRGARASVTPRRSSRALQNPSGDQDTPDDKKPGGSGNAGGRGAAAGRKAGRPATRRSTK